MGNSGGPMFDMQGNVIGINSALISPTGTNVGIGLAIPAELAQPVIESLRKGQAPQRGRAPAPPAVGLCTAPIPPRNRSATIGAMDAWSSRPPGFIQVNIQLIMPNSSMVSGSPPHSEVGT